MGTLDRPMAADELKAFQAYVNGTEQERLDYERLWLDNPGEGYEHKRVYQPWPAEEAHKLTAIAQRLLFDHGHPGYWDELTRENCSACVLGGFEPRGGWDDNPGATKRNGPNYAGWARVFIQAHRAIPANWRRAFAEQGHDNRAYYDAIGRDLVTYGATFSKGGVSK